MKEKIGLMLIIIGMFISSFNVSYAKNIYDEENNTVYIGGWPIEALRSYWDKSDEKISTKLFSVDFKRAENKLFYSTQMEIGAYDLSFKNYIAICTQQNNKQGDILAEKLIILDKDGKIIKTIEGVVTRHLNGYFSWSPDGKKIVYVTGKAIMEERYPFEPKGIFIYDILLDKIIKISEKGTDVRWAKYDKKIYIQDNFLENSAADISVYDPVENKLMKTSKKGFVFSDDGKYYIAEKLNGFLEESMTEYSIYDNTSNKPIYHFNEDEKYLLDESYGNYQFIKNTHNLLIVGSSQYKVFDVDKQKVIANWKKSLIGFNADMTKGIIYEGGGKFVHILFLIDGIKIKSVPIPQSKIINSSIKILNSNIIEC